MIRTPSRDRASIAGSQAAACAASYRTPVYTVAAGPAGLVQRVVFRVTSSASDGADAQPGQGPAGAAHAHQGIADAAPRIGQFGVAKAR